MHAVVWLHQIVTNVVKGADEKVKQVPNKRNKSAQKCQNKKVVVAVADYGEAAAKQATEKQWLGLLLLLLLW